MKTPSPVPSDSRYAGERITQHLFALMERDFPKYKRVREYANELGITPGYLIAVVRRATGRTPKQLFHRRLLQEAKRLLLHTNKSITEIGEQLAFTSQSYFTQWFTKLEGTPPTTYQEKHRRAANSGQD